MALSDFWEIKDFQEIDGKEILNVYHAKRILAGANASIVTTAFINHIVEPHLLPLQVAALVRTTILVENLGDVTDFLETDSSSLVSSRLGEQYAAFNAATIQFNRTRTDMKNGQKRFVAGNENDALDGIWDATMVGLLDALASDIITPWERDSAPGIDVCEFVVLKRFCKVAEQEPCLQYRLPDTSAEIDANHYVPLATITRDRVRSQVSRKVL